MHGTLVDLLVEGLTSDASVNALVRQPQAVEVVDLETAPAFMSGADGNREHKGQMRAWLSAMRIVAVFAGWQAGKTVAGPWLLLREIQRRGSGDYGVLCPNYPLLKNKALPELLAVVGPYFRHLKADNVLELTPEGAMRLWGKDGTARILLRHADSADAVEAMTLKGLWIDEPGQIKDEVWESAQARCAVHQGRIFLTSRPYRKNWYITQIWDRRGTDPDVDVINFSSLENPAFPKAEYDRQKRLMPAWKHRMKYDGIYSRPAGLVYDCVERSTHSIPRFALDPTWERQVWVDFGNNNTAALKVALEPREGQKPRLIIYEAYRPADRRGASGPTGHVASILRGEPSLPLGIGGSHQEDGWRESWAGAGLPVKEPPANKIDVQIAQTYESLVDCDIVAFDDLEQFWEEIEDLAWPTDDQGNVTSDDKPENDTDYHFMACLRYGATHNNPPKAVVTQEWTVY